MASTIINASINLKKKMISVHEGHLVFNSVEDIAT